MRLSEIPFAAYAPFPVLMKSQAKLSILRLFRNPEWERVQDQ